MSRKSRQKPERPASARGARAEGGSPEPVVERAIVIDGYNLILRSPAFRPDDRRDLRAARDKLVNLLSWAVGRGEIEFVVVFDGAESAFGTPGTTRSGRVTVRFSRPPQNADGLIRELVEDYTERGRTVTVVTADLEVAAHARACGATVALSDLFAASLFPERVREMVEEKRAGSSSAAEPSEKPLGFSKKQLQEWSRLFSEERREEEGQ